ncbi:hypothetical protein NVP1091O_23 [Vibrio phage 1.091.O._10N.286.52.B12]|nr:hypothetical protein NVP1091O_23 [Vibrio phage 1.091.O._10N.286.52.B12]
MANIKRTAGDSNDNYLYKERAGFNLKFTRNNGVNFIGELYEGEDGKLRFKGDLQGSARVLFDLTCGIHNSTVLSYQERIKKLEFMVENGLGWEDLKGGNRGDFGL